MPNPVAEVVERLRSIGGPTREEAADLIEHQQAEIERLSRERDTGVPEELLNTVELRRNYRCGRQAGERSRLQR